MITFKDRGSFKNTFNFLRRASKYDIQPILERYGREGVMALQAHTPVDTGVTAQSWGVEVSSKGDRHSITWTNSHIVSGVKIAIILQYGHATRNGGYVQGIDYINPALLPIFDKIAEEVWREVSSL